MFSFAWALGYLPVGMCIHIVGTIGSRDQFPS